MLKKRVIFEFGTFVWPTFAWPAFLGPTSFWSLLWLLCFSSCTNSGTYPSTLTASTTPSASPSASPSPTPSSSNSFKISNVSVTAPSSNGNAASPVTAIYFDNTTQSTTTIANFCNTATTGSTDTPRPCFCRFTWDEVPPPGSTTTSSINHTVNTPLTLVQSNLVTCSVPAIYQSEIPNNTSLAITVTAGVSNPALDTFSVNTFNYMKNSAAVTGSFTDSQGRIFDNILRYSCHGMRQKGSAIQSKQYTTTNSNSGMTARAFYATRFCVSTSSSTDSAVTSDCPNLTPAEYSTENNYFNLFIRNSEKGDINRFNDNYSCPLVKEALNSGTDIGTKNQYWPLDSSFALSLGPTPVFSLGVMANTHLSLAGPDSSASQGAACYSTANQGGGTAPTGGSSFVGSCLGFAAPAKTDGTCPSFTDGNNQTVMTYRLRKYVAVYPKSFQANGAPFVDAQQIDTIYVIDRPVKNPNSTDPLQQYSMRGPKPCPFSYFDRKAVSRANPANASLAAYVSSNNPNWAGKNVDGIEFPNQDIKNQSCSAAMPILNSVGQFSIQTVNINNKDTSKSGATSPAPDHYYVRPIQPFLPHYEEDTSFMACAPLSNQPKDPPLHFVRDTYTGNVAWCAEAYPTQNDNLSSIDPPSSTTFQATGNISPYTSHTVKNSTSAPCAATLPNVPNIAGTYTYPGFSAGGGVRSYATHPSSLSWDSATANLTCDRTVVSNRESATTPGVDWPRFPLLAQASEIENATYGIASDKSYHCLVSYDNGGSKKDKLTPSEGCCAAAAVTLPTGSSAPYSSGAAHLEPGTQCGTPTY